MHTLNRLRPGLYLVALALLLQSPITLADRYDDIYSVDYDQLKASKQEKVRENVDAWVGEQLAKLASQVRTTSCRMLVNRQEDAQDSTPRDCANAEQQTASFQYKYVSTDPKHPGKGRKISRKDQVEAFWPGNFEVVLQNIEARLQPLAKHHFRNRGYSINGRTMPEGETSSFYYSDDNHSDGAEFLLRDGRTLLSVGLLAWKSNRFCSRGECSGGKTYNTTTTFALLDVRQVPVRSLYRRLQADGSVVGSIVNPAYHKLLRRWGAGTISREVDTSLLDPAVEASLQIDPALQELGRNLAALHWSRLDFMLKTAYAHAQDAMYAANSQSESVVRARNVAEAREAAEYRERTGMSGGSPILAGISAGLQSAARTQNMWDTRAAQAQGQMWRAANGCSATSCAPGYDKDSDDRRNDHRHDRGDGDNDDDGQHGSNHHKAVAAASTSTGNSAAAGTASGGSGGSSGNAFQARLSITDVCPGATEGEPGTDISRRRESWPSFSPGDSTLYVVAYSDKGRCANKAALLASSRQQLMAQDNTSGVFSPAGRNSNRLKVGDNVNGFGRLCPEHQGVTISNSVAIHVKAGSIRCGIIGTSLYKTQGKAAQSADDFEFWGACSAEFSVDGC